MNPTRREFIRLGLGSSALLSCGTSVPGFLANSARALAAGQPESSRERVLVALELTGGNDGLNTVVPYHDDNYRKYRPKIHVPANSVHKIDDRMGLHPLLGGLAKLHEKSQLAIVQSVGYPNPSRSHFRSTAIWQTARLNPESATQGWLNRCLEQRVPAATIDAPALHISDLELPQALAGRELHVPSLTSLEQVRRRLGLADGLDAQQQRTALDKISSLAHVQPDSHLQFIQRSALMTYATSARLEEVLRAGPGSARSYPEFGLAKRLNLIAQLIKAGLTTSIYYTQLGGFDTHLNQVGSHPALLQELGGSLRAFFDDLNAVGEAKRVLVLVYSEFGRRLAENASGGTDHGTAAPVFLLGPAVRPGLHGPHPNLEDLEDGDPKYAIDFRWIYATVLDGWLGCPSENALGARFQHLPVLF
jgi:uncharacterized protein (DUF1501 family)